MDPEGEEALVTAEEQNAASLRAASEAEPAVIEEGSVLWQRLHAPGAAVPFLQSTYVVLEVAGGIPVERFLATRELLTCVAVFAHAPSTPTRPTSVGYAAHIDMETYLGSARRSAPLAALQTTLKAAFTSREIDLSTVTIHVVGGHSLDNEPNALRGHIGLYDAVIAAIKPLGCKLNTELGLLFKGQKFDLNAIGNIRKLYEANQVFVVAALDVCTGRVVGHTSMTSLAPLPCLAEGSKTMLTSGALKPGNSRDLIPACARCGARASSQCSQCKRTRYCQPSCSKKHWKLHKPDCKKA